MLGKFYKLTGESGTVNIIAPLPGSEKLLVPIIFVADTFAQIDAPQLRLNGEVIRTETGTVHNLLETICAVAPLQLDNYVV